MANTQSREIGVLSSCRDLTQNPSLTLALTAQPWPSGMASSALQNAKGCLSDASAHREASLIVTELREVGFPWQLDRDPLN